MNDETQTRIILGIDPGSNILGYAFLHISPASRKPRLLSMGVLDMRKQEEQLGKLKQIYDELTDLIRLYTPTDAAIEAPFYGKDAQAMLKLGRAQGVAMIAVASNNIPVTEYSPRTIKKSVTGNGNASKEQVAAMLVHLVEGEIAHKYLDASDALGIAYCHFLGTGTSNSGQTKTQQKKNASKTSTSKKYTGWDAFVQENTDRLND
jgi:crossover junction endodeoxyribonuclease RuvC